MSSETGKGSASGEAATLAVLITYYNEGPLLTRCLESLLAGEVLPDEILVYDDASPKPAEEYAVWHERIRIIRGDENKGAVYGRDLLLKKTRCDYAHFHDSDDTFAPDWAAVIKDIIAAPDAPDLVITNCEIRESPNLPRPVYSVSDTTDDIVRYFIRYGANTLVTTFRKAVADKIGGYETRDLVASEDRYFNIRVALHASSHRFVDRLLVVAHFVTNSLTRDDKGQGRIKLLGWDHIKSMEYLAEELPAAYADDLADRIAIMAAMFFNNGFEADAEEALRRAYKIGTPTFAIYPVYRRVMSRILGPMTTFRIERIGRRLLPEGIMARLRRNYG